MYTTTTPVSTCQDRQHHPAGAPSRPWTEPSTTDRQFAHMLEMFRPTGGVASITEVRDWLKGYVGPARASLDTWIVRREVLCFEWQSRAWLPWFQFDRHTMAPHIPLRPLMAQLSAVYEPWEIANWFALPHPWLRNRVPVETLLSDLPGVLHAARADSVIANGDARSPR